MELPQDASAIEKEIYHYLITGLHETKTDAYIYAQIDDPVEKFIMLWVFGLQKTQKDAAIATGLSESSICIKIQKVKTKLRDIYKNKLYK